MKGARLTVFHTSDFQVGAPFLPEAAEAMLRVFESVSPDVVVVSGDLTQRAKRREFQLARRTLDRFGAGTPIVVTPGNHDVPLYRFWERIAGPFMKWDAFVGGGARDTVTRVPGATFVALASAAPRRAVVNGRIDEPQLAFARRAFAAAPSPDDLRIVVTHHHFVPAPDGDGGSPLPRATEIAAAFQEMGADAVLGGHVHQLHLTTSDDLDTTGVSTVHGGGGAVSDSDVPLPFLATGTSTSKRGRGVETGWNSLCVHRFGADEIEVTPFRRAPAAGDFEEMEVVRFGLRPRGASSTKGAREGRAV